MTEHLPDSIGSTEEISPRHVFEARIQLRLQRDQRKISLPGWVRDLSESGLRAFVAEALMPYESVLLEIPLPNNDKQTIPAKVVRVRRATMPDSGHASGMSPDSFQPLCHPWFGLSEFM